MVKVLARSNNIWGPTKSHISWILNHSKKLWKSLISQPHMLYWWDLPKIHILIRSFIGQNLVVCLVGCKTSHKINFLAQFRPFLNTSKNCSISDATSCWSSLVKKFRLLLGSSCQKSTQKQRKTTVSTGTKAFEKLQLENCRSYMSKNCPVCVPP